MKVARIACVWLCLILPATALCPAGAKAQEGCVGAACGGPPPEPAEEPPPPPPPPPALPQRQDDRPDRPSSPPPAVATAPSGAPEYVLAGGAEALARAVAIARAQGANVLREDRLGSIGVSMAVIDLNRRIAADDLRRLLAAEGLRITFSHNSTYRMAEGPRIYAAAMVGLEAASPCFLRAPVTIGLIDGPVDRQGAALQGVTIIAHSLLESADEPATADHATALAGLIASPGHAGFPAGIAPGARLLSAVAFAREGGRNLARMDKIAGALDWLAGRGAVIVNMSLSGPPNDTLALVLGAFAERGMILVAATGNDGAAVSYPASDPNVLAISAVDARARLYPRANRGPEVDFVAPGVDVLVAEGDRAAYRSGTSYAAAVATGLIAQLLATHGGTADELVARLRGNARDLGSGGHDRMFGWGLAQLDGCDR